MTVDRAQSIVDNFNHVLTSLTKRLQSVNKVQLDELLIRDIDAVSRNDYRRIVDFSAPLPNKLDTTVHELILSRCSAPGADRWTAVDAWDGSFTYAELAGHISRLAGAISDAAGPRNHRRGQPKADGSQLFVPFCLTKSKWTPVAILAIMAAGGACVPLEPSHPPARRNEILTQTKAKIVLTNKTLYSQGLAESFMDKTLVRHVLCIDAEENTSDRSTFPKARPTVLPDDLCYIIFTSGSSGTPKGVKWAHTALATSAWEHGRAFHMDVKSRVLQFASHVFDVSVAELVTPLIHGGCVVVPADEDRTDPASMAKFMDKMKVTNAILVPSFARLLKPYAVPSLKSLVLGGESIGQDNLDNWTPQLDRFVIGYGSAETAVCCARNEFSVKTRARKPWVEGLGTGCGGRMLIADRDNADRLVPIGAVGEIIVEGPILADGYLNDASKTARAFVENPAWATKAHFRTGNGSSRRRFYRTGDLGRQAMDGSITFMGRADFQVKVRGQRMELGEVRSHMIDCLPEAVDIHVDVIRPVAADGAGGDKSLAAFISFGHSSDDIVVSQPDSSLAEALRTMLTRLREVLPPAAIPTFFIPLGGFPYLVSGKVDRRRLLAFANQSTVEDLSAYNATFIGSSGSGEIVATAAPETELEKVLVECCGKILRLPSLSANSNFFASGGDSISAIKVVAEAREKGVNIAVGDIFSTSSIRELAGHVTASSGQYTFSRDSEYIDNAVDAFSLLEPDQIREAMTDLQKQGVTYYGITDLYPCTPLQEALIALSGTRTGAYVSQHILDLPRHVDIAAFKASWAAIVQKHDILRTRIFEGPQGAVQAVCDSEIEWATGPNLSVYCAQDKSLPMGFGDNLVRFGLVGRTFVLTIHHSIFDGWSIARLFEDVERHYAGQKSLDLKQFKYFIQYSSRLDTEEPKRFWESVLASESGLASCHFPQNLGASHTPIPDSAVKLTIPTSQYAKSDFTIPTRIRAAWALLVGRYIDSQDVIFGETLSGRMSTMPDVQAISGPTISTVPFRVKWTSNEPVSNLLHEIQSQVIDMTNSGHIGVQNISRLNATAQEACQFQHIIVIQPKKSSLRPTGNDAHGTRQRIGLEDATLDLRNFHNYALNMDFTLEEDAVMVTTTFDSRVFSARDIEHLQSQFHHVLDQVCRSHNDPQSSIGDIDYAGRKDTQVQIDTNNSRALSDDFEPTSLLRFLGRHVAEHPEAPAVAAWDGSMTYKELDRVSTALANHLSSSGLRHGDCIPYCFPKSIWATVSILATIKIGAISVALEPAYPDAGLAKVISQVKPRMILCSDDLSSRLRSLGQGTSSLFAVDSRSTRECIRASDKAAKRKYNVRHDDTAFIVFTSGSTGEPKGIPLDHGAVCIMARQHGKVMNIDRHSRILQFAAHVFDVSLGDMATALLHGACLCVPSDDDRMSNLARSINYLDANRAWLTPTVASLISPAECPTLEWLSVGGEQLTQTCKDIWASVPLVNVYGPAEVTNIGTAVKVSPDLSLTNIGRANGVKVWICEPGNTQKLAPVGCVGEIVFEGRNVSRGYLNNIDLTASAFPELLSWTSGRMQGGKNPVRMYRTGDLGRLNADGSIEFMGRKDTQIKLRGQRVEVTAVETALKAATDEPVDLAVDILHGSGDSDASLVAFLHLPSRQAGFADNTSDIFSTTIDIRSLATDVRSRVKADLPAHMIPTLFIPLSRLPKLVSGKIDRKMLRLAAKKLTDNEIRSFKLDQGASKQQPRTPAEAVMQKLWASILRLPESDIGVDDDFVSLGGDSITAIKLVAQARAQDIQLSVAKVFQQATIANICGTTNIPVAAVPVEPEGTSIAPAPVTNDPKVSGKWADIALQCDVSESQIEDVYPCTALQEGMLMLTEKKPTAYIAHHVMPLPSWVDISIFRRAWEAVIRTHAILRTRITVEGQQVVLRAGSVGWTTPVSNDLSAYIEQTGLTPMGFGRCLSRQAILDHPKRFVWAAHHSLYDGWSMPLLAEAITKAYMRLSGRDISLDQPKDACLSFKDFVDHISSVSKDETETFWQDQLNGADPAAFPPGMPSSYEPLADSMVEKTVAFNRDQRSKTTTSAMIRAAWAILVSAYSGSHPDIVFGSAVTGRSVPLDGVLELIGPTLATVPVRVVLDPKQSLRSLLAKVQQQSLAMLEYEQHGLQNIRKAVPSAPTACDFQSLLVVHAEGGAQTTSSQTNLSWSNDRGAESKFLTTAVTLECQPVGSKLALAASFDSSIMDQKQMQRMLATFEHILRQVCSGENTLIVGDIETISPDDRAEISSIAKDLPPVTHERVHDMFARQAAMTPDAMAVSASDGDFTYRQLDHLSTKVSRHLRSLGVGAECFVPFCFEKSKWVPVALLAILKAGGACVPLDPAQPLDRLQHITGTLDARVIVTSATHDRLLEDVPGVQHIVPVSEDSLNTLAIAAPSARRAGVKAEPSPSSACYAIFTSGSTGTPKGVVWEHATLCSSMTEHGAAFNYSMKSRVLQFSSHTFDVSVSELLTTLVHGGCLCIPDDFTRLNDIAGFIAEKQVNWAFFAPSFARLMNPATVPGLETVVLGGEAPGKDNIERWSGRPGLELIVTYGPAESCIYCAKNSVRNSSGMIDGSIGHAIGGTMWVADLGRPDRLAPIGSVGEIAVEGSILARGYLKDAAKTASSFRPMPADWANGRSSRVYYTGDLGRVNSDGTISCLGRRDDQVKIRGQRVELADIEYHLRKDDEVRQALVLYPRTGPCADHLTGILSMKAQDGSSKPSPSSDITMASAEEWEPIAAVQERLESKVPSYMVPANWIVLDSIPLMPASQKVNRKMVSEWTKQMDRSTYEEITRLSSDQTTGTVSALADKLEEKIRDLWCAVLNINRDIIGPNTSFLRIGGDSITAMQIISRCRNEGIYVAVQDLLKAKNFTEFCGRVRAVKAPDGAMDVPETVDDEDGTPFSLSPIQSWFMTLAPYGENHFNQSHLLRFTEEVKFDALQAALLAIVQRHPMLRARFEFAPDGAWQQCVFTDAEEFLQCRSFQSVTMKKAAAYAFNAQASLDIVNGPLLAADMYAMTNGTLALFITCHHLVIDLVSWRIILQELEEILRIGKTATDRKSLSFRTWSRLLEEHSGSSSATNGNLFDNAPSADWNFWGISSGDNVVANITEQNFDLDQDATQLLLGNANDAFNTEPLDLLLTAVLHSFNQVFRGFHGPIAVFNESHGREPWRPEIDVSSTVGWFTSMCPVTLSDHGGDVLRSLQEVKDLRRRSSDTGLSAFGRFAKQADDAVEVTFNYFGLFQQFEKEGSLLNQMSWDPVDQPSDASPDVPRFSLFDISAGVENGTLKVNFAFSDRINHQSLVRQWVDACSSTLGQLVHTTSEHQYDASKTLTLSDFPHLPATYDELSVMLTTTLPNAGVSVDKVQDIYPCSSMQTALLMSQGVDKSLYAVRYVWEVIPKTTGPASLERMKEAWKKVIQSHPMLRTVFVQGLSSGDGKRAAVYHQVVLKELEPSMVVCKDPFSFPVGQPQDHIQGGAAHHVVLCQEYSGKLLVQLDISHALVDGTSINILIDSMIKAYDGTAFTGGDQDCYANFVSYLRDQDVDESLTFWKTYLAGQEPCHFPSLRSQMKTAVGVPEPPAAHSSLEYLDFHFPNPTRLHSSCMAAGTTTASVFKLAWALVLQSYTGVNAPCFGFLASGRDLPIDGIEAFVGPFINMLVCQVSLEEEDATVEAVLSRAHSDYANCLAYQVCSLAEILRALQLPGGGRLFNTVMSVQRLLPPGTATSKVDFKPVHVEDPSEVSCSRSFTHIYVPLTPLPVRRRAQHWRLGRPCRCQPDIQHVHSFQGSGRAPRRCLQPCHRLCLGLPGQEDQQHRPSHPARLPADDPVEQQRRHQHG